MLPPFRAHVDVWVILGSLAAAYLIACRRHAERTGVPMSDHARRLFLTGVAVVSGSRRYRAGAADSPPNRPDGPHLSRSARIVNETSSSNV